ncbi:MAG: DUF2336 domain-containing protein [Phreatobacter sp.]|jgi:uncharacterized protein (DUF2336 family)|uniref:DUF2336 domain-containing protein n=1 Tax=Phreatobacter sp. TaxID=1966341 RepID=UPI0040364179
MTDVTEVNHAIDDLVAQRSRAGLADKVNTLIGTFAENSGTYTAEQAETVDGVIARLVADVSPVDRMAIAARIASDPHAPPGVVARLACDDWIEVASPILTQSPCLSDETLLKVIDSKGHSHLLAISRRRALPADVADKLIERGNRSVVKSLARNPGADLSAEARRSLERRQRERFEELRKTPRKAVAYPAQLSRPDGSAAHRCRLIDVSRTGAKLSLATMARLSGPLLLSFANAAVRRPCEAVWQDGRDIGVRFT